MKTTTFVLAASALALLSLSQTTSAQLLFSDDFDSGLSAGNWRSNLSHSDAFADYAFDYSSLGIPTAPNSTNGSTIGLGFVVNQTAGVFQGISASPVDFAVDGDFRLQFDLWINFIGPFPGGGTGSTQMATMGWGTSGTSVQWAGSNDSVVFGGTGDGGTTFDYRVYLNTNTGVMLTPGSGAYAAGTTTSPEVRNSTHPYYLPLGGKPAPEAQTTLFPSQAGTTGAGALGMAWRDVVIERSGDTMTWTVDNLLLASVSISGTTLGGKNFHLGMFDPFSGSTGTDAFLNTAIFDNIRVTAVPEPSSAVLAGCGALLLMRRRRATMR